MNRTVRRKIEVDDSWEGDNKTPIPQPNRPLPQTILKIGPNTDLNKRVAVEIIESEERVLSTWAKPEPLGKKEEVEYKPPQTEDRPSNIPKEVQDGACEVLAKDAPKEGEGEEEEDGEGIEISVMNPYVAQMRLDKYMKQFPELKEVGTEFEDPRIRLEVIEDCIRESTSEDFIQRGSEILLGFVESFLVQTRPQRFQWIKPHGMADKVLANPEWHRSVTQISLMAKPVIDSMTGGAASSPYMGLGVALLQGLSMAHRENTKNDNGRVEEKDKKEPPPDPSTVRFERPSTADGNM